MITEAIILAGGLGTRLKSIIQDTPKPMVLIHGKPFLSYLIDYVRDCGINRIILSVGYKYQDIQSFFSDKQGDADLLYSIEDEPCGTGGGILKALNYTDGSEVFVLNGDSMFRIDLSSFVTFHLLKHSSLSIALRRQQKTQRFGLVEINDQRQITGFIEKDRNISGGWINGGIYLINKPFFQENSPAERFSLEIDFLPRCINLKQLYGYPVEGYFIDIGTPESYQRAQHDFKRFEY